MEHISQSVNILDKWRERAAVSQSLPVYETLVTDESDCPKVYKNLDRCLECEDFIIVSDGQRILHRTAECRKKKKRACMLARSGLFGKDTEETFAAAKIDQYNRDLYGYLQYKWDRKQWLYIFNANNGTGKSYTANAIANMLLAQNIQPLVMREIDMANEIKRSFDDPTGDTEYALMGRFKAVPVLIIQDFGKQGSKSEWWPQKVYDLIDHRLIKRRTTVFTSNFDITNRRLIEERFGENHGPAIYSRLNGICDIWSLGGPDRRLEVVT